MVASNMVRDAAVRALLDAGADVNLRNGQEQTALSIAAEGMHKVRVVHMLLQAGAEVNTQDRRKRTLFMRLQTKEPTPLWPCYLNIRLMSNEKT